MCGIFGVAVSDKAVSHRNKYLDTFVHGLYATQVRGEDGTGVFSVEYYPKSPTQVRKSKAQIRASTFLETRTFDNFMRQSSLADVVIGHTRKATTTKMDFEATHPHEVGDIILVHNGVVEWVDYSKWMGGVQAVTDSYAIAHLLNACENPKDALEQIPGAYALVWYDRRKDMVMAARNDKRPIEFIVDQHDSLILGSEGLLCEWAGWRNGLNKVKNIWALSPGQIMAIPRGTPADYEITKYKVKEAEAIKTTSYKGPNHNYNRGVEYINFTVTTQWTPYQPHADSFGKVLGKALNGNDVEVNGVPRTELDIDKVYRAEVTSFHRGTVFCRGPIVATQIPVPQPSIIDEKTGRPLTKGQLKKLKKDANKLLSIVKVEGGIWCTSCGMDVDTKDIPLASNQRVAGGGFLCRDCAEDAAAGYGVSGGSWN